MCSWVGTLHKVFSFDSPVVSFTQVHNQPTSARSLLVTILGLNFGALNYTQTANSGGSLCASVSWTSTSQILCRLRSGSGPAHSTTVNVLSQGGTELSTFTFDAPIISALHTRAAADGAPLRPPAGRKTSAEIASHGVSWKGNWWPARTDQRHGCPPASERLPWSQGNEPWSPLLSRSLPFGQVHCKSRNLGPGPFLSDSP